MSVVLLLTAQNVVILDICLLAEGGVRRTSQRVSWGVHSAVFRHGRLKVSAGKAVRIDFILTSANKQRGEEIFDVYST